MSNRLSRTIALAAKRLALALLAATALIAGPSGSQVTDAPATAPPKSLLPEGFAAPAAPVVEAAPLPVAPQAADAPDASRGGMVPGATPLPAPSAPPPDRVVQTIRDPGGFGDAAFAGSDGRFVAGLLRRLTAPGASRWSHIILRRALLTAGPPVGAAASEWVAERARVLFAIGEVDAAKALLDPLPPDQMTPQLIRIIGQVTLAAGDIPGLCPVADAGDAVSPDPLWRLATAMCAAIGGDDVGAASAFDRLHHDRVVDGFDLQLGERIAAISLARGRAANLDWSSVRTMTPYRFGVAVAADVAIPLPLLTELAAKTGGTSWGWMLRAPGQIPAARAAALEAAAVLGIASADDFVGGIAAASAGLDRSALAAAPAGRLRDAYAAPTTAARVAALRSIVADAGDGGRYAALIETGLAAARLPVDRAFATDAGDLIAAMLAVGVEDRAARWWPVVATGDDVPSRAAWALLAVGANGGIPVSPTQFAAWAKDVSPHRAALFLAALDGLGSARGAAWDRICADAGLVPMANSWTRAIDAAGAAKRPGEVAVLAATGLQTNWRSVPPAHLRHIVAAWVAAGHGHEARMLAAEAVTRG